jgi:putative transposase
VVSDAHPGLKNAIAQVVGAQWQRCAVHFVRDMLGHVPRPSHPLVRGALKQVFAALDRDMAAQVARGVIEQLASVAPKVAALLEEAEEDLLAYMRFPRDHWSKIRSTNPLERVNREIARRSDVVGIYPDDAALLRLAAGVLVEINDEWLVMHRYISHASMALLAPDEHGSSGPAGADPPALQGALAGAGKSTT